MSAAAAMEVFERRREYFLAAMDAFLRFPTISARSEYRQSMQSCAGWLRDRLEEAGLRAEIRPTRGHPAVLADSGPPPEKEDYRTLLFYGHYDVQPVGDEKLWHSPPFEPTLRDGAWYARGSADDKGQVMTHLTAVRCWRDSGHPWPVRIRFLIEGEEEIGSPNLPELLRNEAPRLACDHVVISDTSRLDDGTPALAYATRGLVYKEIILDGPDHDLHSGQYGGAVANPANVLAGILARLKNADGRVTIPGFYDDVVPLDETDRRCLARYGLTDDLLLKRTGCPAPDGEVGYTTAERCTARPTLDINGLYAGYTGEGAATIIPARAGAKVSMRLVARQDPERISQAFDQTVRDLCPSTVRCTIRDHSHCAAYLAPTDTPAMQAAIRALRAAYQHEPALTREGGTLPILPLFKEVLGADSLMLGFADPNCNLHSPNEFFHLADYLAGTRCILHLLEDLGS